jgi:hypothetical protein
VLTAADVSEATEVKITATVKQTDPESGRTKDLTKTVTVKIAPDNKAATSKADNSHTLSTKKSLAMNLSDPARKELDLKFTVSPKGGKKYNEIKIVEISSTNENIVSINNAGAIELAAEGNKGKGSGKISLKGIAPGTAYVIIKTSGSETGAVNVQRCKVTVTSPATEINVKSGTLKINSSGDTKTIEMRKGESGTIEVDLTPENTTDHGKWKITGSKGVTVKNGIIIAKKVTENAVLTVKCGKLKQTIKVKIK